MVCEIVLEVLVLSRGFYREGRAHGLISNARFLTRSHWSGSTVKLGGYGAELHNTGEGEQVRELLK